MAAQAAAVMNDQPNGNGMSGQWGALGPAQGAKPAGAPSAPVGAPAPQPPQPRAVGAPKTPAPRQSGSGGGSKWSALG